MKYHHKVTELQFDNDIRDNSELLQSLDRKVYKETADKLKNEIYNLRKKLQLEFVRIQKQERAVSEARNRLSKKSVPLNTNAEQTPKNNSH